VGLGDSGNDTSEAQEKQPEPLPLPPLEQPRSKDPRADARVNTNNTLNEVTAVPWGEAASPGKGEGKEGGRAETDVALTPTSAIGKPSRGGANPAAATSDKHRKRFPNSP
jgi:hypothetical protein